MTNMVSRLLAIGLALLLCVFAPFSLSVLADNVAARHSIIAECENFVDEVSDTGRLTDEMLSNFYLDVSSHGVMLDVEVEKYTRVVENDISASGKLVTTYLRTACNPRDEANSTVLFNTGDKIVVHIEPIGYSAGQRIVMSTIGRILPEFDYTFPKRVR